MPTYKTFHGSSGSVLIEVITSDADILGSGGKSGNNLEEPFRVVKEIAASASKQFEKISKKNKPGEIEISFNLITLEKGSIAISTSDDKRNFLVKMKWSTGPLIPSEPQVPEA